MIIDSSCLWCLKKFWFHEVIVWKMPENAWFCLECCEKYPDNTVYDWKYNVWIPIEFEPWINIEYE